MPSDPSMEAMFALRDALREQQISPDTHSHGALLGTAKRLIEELRKRGFDVVPATPTEAPPMADALKRCECGKRGQVAGPVGDLGFRAVCSGRDCLASTSWHLKYANAESEWNRRAPTVSVKKLERLIAKHVWIGRSPVDHVNGCDEAARRVLALIGGEK